MNKKINDNLEEETKKNLSSFLPYAIDKVLKSYQDFLDTYDPKNSKDFSAHHSAGKAAINHLELLLKLSKQVGVDEEMSLESENSQILFKELKKRIEEHQDLSS